MIPCELYNIVAKLLQIYMLIMLAYALVSWVPSIRGKWTEYVAMLVEPVLTPVRRIIPPIGGLDLSFIVVIVLIQMVIGLSKQYAFQCSF
jgi:YggT family protein